MVTTVAKLRSLTGSIKVDADLQLFVEQGNLAVAELLPASLGLSSGRSDLIALYLAGHYYVLSIESGGVTYQRMGQSERRYKSFGYDAAGFGTTRFGQQAIAEDTTGTLAQLSRPGRYKFEAESYTAPKNAVEYGDKDTDFNF